MTDDQSITCPRCGMTSYNPNDVREGYCGNCHDWTTTATQPRFGTIRRREGYSEPVQFVATSIPQLFEALDPDGNPVTLRPGDKLTADVLGPGQSIQLALPDPE